MKVVVLGLGISGKAAAHYLMNRGESVIGVDRNLQAVEGIECLHESTPISFQGVDLLIKSPGIPPTHPWVVEGARLGIPIMGEIDLAFSALKQKNKRVLAITGSNGKTTTTLMTTHLLNVSGQKAVAVGNVGTPLITLVDSDWDVFVVELSSFQLEGILENRVLDGAALLNITPNHLDRHPSFKDYIEAKLRITLCLKEKAPFYLSRQAAEICGSTLKEFTIFDLMKEKIETIFPLSYRDNLYPHDLENASAAFSLARVSDENYKIGLETFIRPPHRLEFVGKVSGVTYINDSKATSVDAVIKGVQAIRGPIILIAGGVDKGGAFSDWIPFFRGKVTRVVALGQSSERIQKELSPEIEVERVSSLEAGVSRAALMAKAGTTVLLSPGCSSYDQFQDYQQRGDVFKMRVMQLRGSYRS